MLKLKSGLIGVVVVMMLLELVLFIVCTIFVALVAVLILCVIIVDPFDSYAVFFDIGVTSSSSIVSVDDFECNGIIHGMMLFAVPN